MVNSKFFHLRGMLFLVEATSVQIGSETIYVQMIDTRQPKEWRPIWF